METMDAIREEINNAYHFSEVSDNQQLMFYKSTDNDKWK